MNKAFSWLVLIGTLWCGGNLRAQASDLVFDVGEVNACYLDTVHIPIVATNYDSIMGFQFYAEWDFDALELLSITTAYPEDFSLVFNSANDLDGVRRVGAATTDLLNTDVSIARTFPDGDTIMYIHAIMQATSGTVSIESEGAILFSNSCFYAENGTRESGSLSVISGEVGYVTEVEGLSITGDTLNCNLTEVRLIASANNSVTNYSWSSNGQPLGTTDTLLTSQPGVYQLRASRDQSCVTEIAYEVELDTATFRPEVDATLLSCAPTEAVLEVSDPQPGTTFVWEDPEGGTSPGSQFTATGPGNHFLYTTSQNNGCVDTQRVVVALPVTSTELADAFLSISDTITCNQTSTTLSVGLPADRFSFEWTAGTNTGSNNTITLDAAIPVVLVVTELADGCTRTLDTLIAIDTLRPRVNITGSDFLDCRIDSAILVAQPVAQATGYGYEWRSGGSLLSTEDSLVVTDGGTYLLQVISPTNGCRFDTLFSVSDLRAEPVINFLELPTAVNCYSSNPTASITTVANQVVRWEGEAGLLSTEETAVLAEGAFSLSLTDTLTGCRADTAFVVGVDTISPTFTIDSTGGLNCAQGEVELLILGAPDGTLCDWNNLNNGACELSVLAAGIQVATVTNPINGCQARDSILISATDIITPLEVSPDTILTCTESTITLEVINANLNLGYTWTDASGAIVGQGPTLSTAEAGVFSVAVTGETGACARQNSVGVDIDTLRPSATISPITLNCQQRSAELSFTTDVQNATITWLGPDMAPLANTLITDGGRYLLVITNPQNNCTLEQSLEVPANFSPPVYALSQPTDIELTCAVPTVSLEVIPEGGYTFRWSDGPGTIITQTSEVSVEDAGEITLVVLDTLSLCRDTTYFTVTDLRALPEVTYSVPNNFDCGQESVSLSLSADPGQTYALTTSAGISISETMPGMFVVPEPNTYILTTQDVASNCVRTDTFTVAAPATDLAFGAIQITQETCAPGSGTEILLGEPRGGTPEYQYELDGANYAPQDFIFGTPDGTYTLRLTDALNCSIDTQVVITGYQPFTPELRNLREEYRLGDPVQLSLAETLDPAYTYQVDWSAADFTCIGCSTFGFTALVSTLLTISVIRSDGCIETLDARIRVNRQVRLYLPTAFSPNDDGINDTYLPGLSPEITRILEMRVYDRWGGEVYRESAGDIAQLGGWNGKIRDVFAAPGTYTTTITYELIDGRSQSTSTDFILLR